MLIIPVDMHIIISMICKGPKRKIFLNIGINKTKIKNVMAPNITRTNAVFFCFISLGMVSVHERFDIINPMLPIMRTTNESALACSIFSPRCWVKTNTAVTIIKRIKPCKIL